MKALKTACRRFYNATHKHNDDAITNLDSIVSSHVNHYWRVHAEKAERETKAAGTDLKKPRAVKRPRGQGVGFVNAEVREGMPVPYTG